MSSNLQQYFGDDYFSSLALVLRAVSPPLVLTISAWGLRECGYLASRVGSYSPPVLQLIVKRRAGGHGTSLKKVTCARIRSHLSLLH